MYPFIKLSVVLSSLSLVIFTITSNQAAGYRDVYWQASVGMGKGADTSLKDNNDNGCAAIAPPALFGCGYSAQGDYRNIREFELGVGLYWNPVIRTELLLDYQTMAFKGNANFARAGKKQPVTADVIANSFLLNTKLDLISLFSDSAFRLRPFINAGIGLSAVTTDKVHFDFPDLQLSQAIPAITKTMGGVELNAIYKLGLGIEWVFSRNMGIQLSYQHFDLGQLSTDEGIAYVYGHGCGLNRAVNPPTAKPIGCNLYVDSIEARIKTNVANLSIWKTF